MPNQDPPAPDDTPAPAPDAPGDLEQRLHRATRAAERLINEAGKPPPAGWQNAETQEQAANGRELELLAQLIRSVRELLPAELERRLAEALRELLLALRALIDFYLERLERRERPDEEARDIPIS